MRRIRDRRAAARTLGTALLAALLSTAGDAAAQQGGEPRRPELPAGADRNDWDAYYNLGVRLFGTAPGRAEDAFWWASKLAPERAEPLFARYAIFWMRRLADYPGYLDGKKEIRERPDVVAADSLAHMAIVRNPFVHRGLQAVAMDRTGGSWRGNLVTQGYLAYANGDYRRAQELLDRAIRRDADAWWLHELRAAAFVSAGQFDSAAVQMDRLLQAARADETGEAGMYESKAMMEYGLGLLHLARNDRLASREALARAVVEDMSFYPAHAALADAATATGDHEGALRAYAQALELDGANDAVVRLRYGALLGRFGRREEALEQLHAAAALEPYWAAPLLERARVLDAGRLPGAAEAYRAWLARAPRRETAAIARAQTRLRALEAAAAAPAPPAEPSAPPAP